MTRSIAIAAHMPLQQVIRTERTANFGAAAAARPAADDGREADARVGSRPPGFSRPASISRNRFNQQSMETPARGCVPKRPPDGAVLHAFIPESDGRADVGDAAQGDCGRSRWNSS